MNLVNFNDTLHLMDIKESDQTRFMFDGGPNFIDPHPPVPENTLQGVGGRGTN